MRAITLEIPDEEINLFNELSKKLNWKVVAEDKMPNKETIKAMKDLKEGKGIKVKNIDEFLKLV